MTDPRAAQMKHFLARAGWDDARRANLAGDASARRYLRLTRGQEGAVLMDDPAGDTQSITPFVTIATHLRALGLSAPAILAEDRANGFLLLEDLGDDLYARVIPKTPDLEETLYAAAVDLLVDLHRAALPSGITAYGPQMAPLAALAFEWYLPAATGARDTAVQQAFQAEIETLLAQLTGAPVLILRDYHAENLLWLPERTGAARVGLLDFQDAMAGPRAYDLVSLLEDARRDVPPPLRARMLARYAQATGHDPAQFALQAAICAAQRNLRIIGVFARLCLRNGKPRYTELLPRVWAHLQDDLSHPALARLRHLVNTHLPAPDAPIRERIKAACATLQTH